MRCPLQVHPTPEQARAGFDAEDAAGIPRDAPHRNYRDPYSKPELIVALTPVRRAVRLPRRDRPGRAAAPSSPSPPSRRSRTSLEADPDEDSVRAMLGVAAELAGARPSRPGRRGRAGLRAASAREQPVRRRRYDWASRVAEDYPGDTGVVVMLMLNLIELAPGEGIFLRPRTLHAYLTGVGVEIMAGSDNVLRGGLTPKHIDIDELLNVLEFSHGPLEPTPDHGAVRRRGGLDHADAGVPALAGHRRRRIRSSSPAGCAADPGLHRGPGTARRRRQDPRAHRRAVGVRASVLVRVYGSPRQRP